MEVACLKFFPEKLFGGAQIFFSFGLGFLGFGLFRLVLFKLYNPRLQWFVMWEEWTELMFVVGLGVCLYSFGHNLFHFKGSHENQTSG